MIGHLLESWRRREFWTYAAWLEIATRYRTSRLGLLWLLLNPAVFTFGLGFVYAKIMGTPAREFIPHLAFGYPLWRLIIHALSESAQCLRASKPFIMEGNVNLVMYVLKVISKAMFSFAFGFVISVVSVALLDGRDIIFVLTVGLTLPIVLINLVWIGVVVSIVSVRLPDASEVINTMLIFGFLLTPVM
ncbi:hypothetical protein AB4144_33300, partial [Rhizobiaceae sp. 2RAB30]